MIYIKRFLFAIFYALLSIVVAIIIRTIHKLRAGNYLNDYPDATDEEVFQWWLSKRNAKAFFGDLKNQMKLF